MAGAPALHVLGSGTAIPHLRRGASGYACIAPGGEVLLLECGPGSSRRWPAHGIELDRIAGIVVTHHHVDHCADLAPALFARNVVEPPCSTPWTLAGPAGHGAFVRALKTQPGKDMLVMSGGNLGQSLLDAGVVDEIGLNVHPLLLGGGVPAFLPTNRRVTLELTENRTMDGGCVLLRYKVKHGTV